MIKKAIRGIYNILQDKLEKYVQYFPKTEKIKIGNSVNGGEIFMYKFGNGDKKILLNFGMHGNEIGTMKCANALMKLIELEKIILPNDISLYIIPCLNIDGFEKAKKNPNYFGGGSIGKLNANGVNLVQNICTEQDFGTQTVSYISGKKVLLDPGTHPFSEPEAVALKNTLDKVNPVLFVDVHNAYPAIGGEIGDLGKQCAEVGREITGWPDREQLYETPDWRYYQNRDINVIFCLMDKKVWL